MAQSWAEAFAAVGTVSAFLIGALVFRQQQSDRRDDEATQARQVLPGRSYYLGTAAEFGGESEDYVLALSAVNHSSEHIYQVLVRRVSEKPGIWSDPVIGYITAHSAEELAPAQSQRLYEFHSDRPLNEFDWAIEFEFVDGNGRRWVRRGLDQPRRLKGAGRVRQ